MIRLIFVTRDGGTAANVGGPVVLEHKTFDVCAPQIEAWLREPTEKKWMYVDRSFVGVEVIPDDDGTTVDLTKGALCP